MKIVLTADIHLGLPNKLDDILYSLSCVRKYMYDRDIENMFVLGDLFHNRSVMAIDVMNRSYEFFKATKNIYNQSVYAFPGNHDMWARNSWSINSLRTFADVINIINDVVLMKMGEQIFCIIPFIHYEEVYMKVLNNVVKKLNKADVILTHIGVNGATLNECFLLKNWNIVDFTNIPNKVYTGHFHCHQQVGSNLWYPGSQIPFRFDEGSVDHGFIVFDTETGTHEFVKIADCEPEPAFASQKRPPDYLTIVDDMIGDMDRKTVFNNHIRISLKRDYVHDEMVVIKQKFLDLGARNISFMKSKINEIDMAKIQSVSTNNPANLLKKWFDYDKPDHIKYEKLSDINEGIMAEGNEKFIVSEIEDA